MDQLERVSLYINKEPIGDVNQFKSNLKFFFNCKDQWINEPEEQINSKLIFFFNNLGN